MPIPRQVAELAMQARLAAETEDRATALSALQSLELAFAGVIAQAQPMERLMVLGCGFATYVITQEWEMAALKIEDTICYGEKHHPNSPETAADYAELARARAQLGQYPEAIVAMETAIKKMRATSQWKSYELDYLTRYAEIRSKLDSDSQAKNDLLDEVSELVDEGLVLRDLGDFEQALGRFSTAAGLVRNQATTTSDDRRALASCLMNQVDALCQLGRQDECQPLLEESLRYMKETTGEESPEVATVLQSCGNLHVAAGNLKTAMDYHQQAYKIRFRSLGKDHEDLAISAYNIAGVHVRQGEYYHATLYAEQALQIFQQCGPADRRFQATEQMYQQLQGLARNAQTKRSEYGQIALILYDPPQSQRHYGSPEQHLAMGGFAHAIVHYLRDAWNEMLGHGSAIPILLISLPGLEEATQYALEHDVAKAIPASLLRHVAIPATIMNQDEAANIEGLIQLTLVRKQVAEWVRNYRTIMVKSVNNRGATLDRRILAAAARDERPITFEAIQFDGRDGPLTGLYKGDNDPRPAIMTTRTWKEQGYTPQEKDERATGALYLNVQALREQIDTSPDFPLSSLDQWSMRPLMDAATRSLEDQLDVFEEAFSDLLLLFKSRPLSCPRERGERTL